MLNKPLKYDLMFLSMRTEEALKHFDNKVRKLAAALNLSVQAIYAWGDEVPRLRAYEIRDILARREQEAAQQDVAA